MALRLEVFRLTCLTNSQHERGIHWPSSGLGWSGWEHFLHQSVLPVSRMAAGTSVRCQKMKNEHLSGAQSLCQRATSSKYHFIYTQTNGNWLKVCRHSPNSSLKHLLCFLFLSLILYRLFHLLSVRQEVKIYRRKEGEGERQRRRT